MVHLILKTYYNRGVVPNDIFGDDEIEDDDFYIGNSKRKPQNLQDLIESEDFFNPIKSLVKVSPGELLFMILKYCTTNKLALTHMSKLIALINSIFEKQVLPQSRYIIDKFFNVNENTTFHVTCPACTKYIGNFENLNAYVIVCDNSKSKFKVSNPSADNLFAITDPSNAIASLINAYTTRIMIKL